jgi:pimeloyl-ACP methyl ester carboxylesterase
MIKKDYVDTRDGQMHFRQCLGGSGAPIVMFHMTAASSLAFEPLMARLEGRFPLLAFDTMNYGESFRTPKPPVMPYVADIMLEALTNIGIDKFHMLGHHTGASIAAEMAAIAPERALSAVLNGPMYMSTEELAFFLKNFAVPNPITVKGTQLIWAWSRIKDNYGAAFSFDAPNAAAILNRETVDMLRSGDNWHWGYQAVFTHDIGAAMRQMKCPIYLLIGRLDDAFPWHERAVKDFPQALTSVHDTGGVYYFESHPADAASRIASFIEGLNRS